MSISCINDACTDHDIKLDDTTGRAVCRGCRTVFYVCPHCHADDDQIVDDRDTGERVCENCAGVIEERSVREEYDVGRHHAPERTKQTGPLTRRMAADADQLVARSAVPVAVGDAAKRTIEALGDDKLKNLSKSARAATLWSCVLLAYESLGVKVETTGIATAAGVPLSALCLRVDAVRVAAGRDAPVSVAGLAHMLMHPLNGLLNELAASRGRDGVKHIKIAVMRIARALEEGNMSSVTNMRPRAQVSALILYHMQASGRPADRAERKVLSAGAKGLPLVSRALTSIGFV
jgi:transcription initiation factor TFIIIB Brf1 subunit/transcription initiation factor TFIIB